jgi:hypothetical protein
MATYIQGVTDYIPDYQPFQPDLNFYASALQTKQNQYDSNYKALNNLYGQYFYADLTRPDNIKKKDQLLKNIDFNLNRVAGLDLSLEQNVQQATQIFTPFYEDQFLMKDMAYTKNFSSSYNGALALQKSKDKETYSKYWNEGVKYMLYEREKFKNSTDEESLGFANAEYVPYKNAIETYMKLAKDMGISADITQSNGRYFVRQKNGDLILQDLTRIFTSAFANDPQLQKVAQVQAVVNREDKIRELAGKYNGDMAAAEREYLQTQNATIQEYIALKNSKNKENLKTVENKTEAVNKKLEFGEGNQFTESYVKSLEKAYGIAQDNVNYSDALSNEISDDKNRTLTTAGGTSNPDDIEQLRYKVDAGTASMFAEQDIAEAAYQRSRVDMVVDISADPYGVSAQNHAFALSRQREAQAHKEFMLEQKDIKDKENLVLNAGLVNGTYIGTQQVMGADGKMHTEGIPNPALFNRRTLLDTDSGAATDGENKIVANRDKLKEVTSEYADPMIKNIVNTLNMFVKAGYLNKGDIAPMFFNGKMDANQFLKNYQDKSYGYLSGKGADYLETLYNKVTTFAMAHRGDAGVADSYLSSSSHEKFDDYVTYLRANKKLKAENAEVIDKNLYSSVALSSLGLDDKMKKKLIDTFYDKNSLMILSKDDFINSNKNMKVNSALHYPIKMADKKFYPYVQEMTEKQYKDWKQDVLKLDKELFSIDPRGNLSTRFVGNVLSIGDENLRKKYNRVQEIKSTLQKMGAWDGNKKIVITDKKDASGKIKPVNVSHDASSIWDNVSREKEEVLSGIYDELTRNFVSTAKGREIKSVYDSPHFKGTGLASSGINGLDVSMAAPTSPGFKAYIDFMEKDMTRINLYDGKNKVSFFGANKTGVNDTEDLLGDNDAAKVTELILEHYYKNIGKKDVKPFFFGSRQIALEDKNTGAMVIKPDNQVLKELIESDTQGLITKEVQQAILKNGISIISNKNNFSNDIFRGNEITPLESMVNALEEITYVNPMGGGEVTVAKNTTGTSDYNIYGIQYYMDKNGQKKSEKFTLPVLMYQNNIDQLFYQAKQMLRENAEDYAAEYRRFHQNK